MVTFLLFLFRVMAGALVLPLDAVMPIEAEHVRFAPLRSGESLSSKDWGRQAFRPATSLNFGAYGAPVLIKIPLDAVHAGRWWLVTDLRTPEFMHARLGHRDLGDFGTGQPFRVRSAKTYQVTLPLDLAAGKDTLWIWASEPNGDCRLDLRLVPDRLFPSGVQDQALWAGIVLGTLFFALMAALVFWRVTAQATYGWYSLHVFLGWLWSLSKNGLLAQHLWPSDPQWNRVAPELLSWATVGAYVFFVSGALELRKHLPRIGRILAGLGWIQFAVGGMAFLSLGAPAFHAAVHSSFDFDQIQLVTLLGLLAVQVWRVVQGDRLARAMLLVLTPLFVSMLYGTLCELPWFPAVRNLETPLLLTSGIIEYLGLTFVLGRELYRREQGRLNLARKFELRLEEEYERFRQGIGADLHDDFSQRLLALRMKLRADGQGHAELESGLSDLGESVRFLSRNLQLPVPVRGKLVPALDGLARNMASPNLEVTVVAKGVEELEASRGILLFRLVQEALSNAVRHGRATRIRIGLETARGELRVEVADNGRGFGSGILAGNGLRTIRHRVEELGALLETRSAPGEGATLIVWVPMRASVRA